MRLLIVILFISAQCFAQHEIKMLEGEDSKYSITAVEWKTQQEIFDWNKKTGEDEMWSDQDKKEFDAYAKSCAGGELWLKIKRITIESANLEWFTVIIKKGNTEIMRTQLKNKIPQTPGNDELWSNSKLLSIKTKVSTPFDVYIIEAGGKPPKYHFQILN